MGIYHLLLYVLKFEPAVCINTAAFAMQWSGKYLAKNRLLPLFLGVGSTSQIKPLYLFLIAKNKIWNVMVMLLMHQE